MFASLIVLSIFGGFIVLCFLPEIEDVVMAIKKWFRK